MTKSHSDDRHDQAPSAMQIGSRSHGGASGLEFAAISLPKPPIIRVGQGYFD